MAIVASATTKTYDPNTKTISLNGIADVKLETPLKNRVSVGDNVKVAEFTIRSFQDYNDFVGNFQFIDLNTGQDISKNISAKYLTYQDVIAFDYSPTYFKNGTLESFIINGTHIEKVADWVDWNKGIMNNENMTIGLFTSVKANDHIEWIPTFAGIKATEWAEWIANGQDHLWRFDDTVSIAKDENNTLNGSLSGGVSVNQLGVVYDGLKAFNFTNGVVSTASHFFNTTESWSFWIYPQGFASGSHAIITHGKGTPIYAGDTIDLEDNFMTIGFQSAGGSADFYNVTSHPFQNDHWYFIYINYSGNTNVAPSVFINNVSQTLNHYVDAGTNKSRPLLSAILTIGGQTENVRNSGFGNFSGKIDQVKHFDQNLSVLDRSNLFLENVSLTAINVTLNSPANASTISTNFTDLNASTNTTADNITFYSNASGTFTIDFINATNGTDYIFNFSNYTNSSFVVWNAYACVSSICDFSANNYTFNILITIAPPTTSIFAIDLSQLSGLAILFIMFAFAIFLAFMKMQLWSGFVFMLLGIVILASGGNVIVSIIFIFAGIVMIAGSGEGGE